MTPEAIAILYNYNYWAFERMWTCIMQLSDEQFITPVEVSSWEIRNHVIHLMNATRFWLGRVQGTDTSDLNPSKYTTRESVKSKWNELKAETLSYVCSLNQAQLDEKLDWNYYGKARCTSHRWEILLHLANHSTDHRAQVLTLLDNHFHVKTVEQDLVEYLAEKGVPTE